METKAGGPGAFARFDLSRVASPAFVVDEVAVERNLMILRAVADQSGARILSALKAFSMWSLAPLVMKYMDGTCASGLWEARLAHEKYGKELATYCAGYKAKDLPEILQLSDHVIFNSPGQIARFDPLIREAMQQKPNLDIGLRINPEHSEGEVSKYDPCQPHSRLGTPVSQIDADALTHVTGLHMHTLCEQDFQPLKRTWDAVRERIMPFVGRLKWLNFGGGHHITRADYQRDELIDFIRRIKAETGLHVYLEPGEAVALDAGILVGEVLDIFDNGMPVAITDISATCHMPDVIEAPYRPAMMFEGSDSDKATRLGGPSCLAGDIIGDYHFPDGPKIGQRFAFLDQAHYSMVKTTTFNGVPLPDIMLWNSQSDELKLVRHFDHQSFVDRLS